MDATDLTEWEAARWKCANCGAVGTFVHENSEQYANMVIDLTVQAWAEVQRRAGYPTLSSQCAMGRHAECASLNRHECDCECHKRT